MDKSERYLKEIAKNTDEIAKELKKMNAGNKRKPVNLSVTNDEDTEIIRSAIHREDASDGRIMF